MKKNQEGMALIVSLSLMTLALVLGVSSMQTSRIEESAAGSNRAAANALMAAEFGLSTQLEAVSSAVLSDYPNCISPLVFANSENINNPQNQTISYSYNLCSDFDESLVRVTVEGAAGDVSRIMQGEMYIQSQESAFDTLAAINLAAQVSSFEAPNSDSFVVEGLIDDKFDGGELPAITTQGQKAWLESQIKSQVGDDKFNNYKGGISDSAGNSILEDANAFFEFVKELKTHAESIGRDFSSIVTTGQQGNRTDLGSRDSPKITYLKGDMQLSGNVSGAGILLVDGDYGTSGTPYFEGLVIVLGDTFGISGGGNGGLSGSLIAAPMVGPEGDKEFASTTVKTSGGGAANYSHNEPALTAAFNLLPKDLQDLWKSSNTTTFLPSTKSVASWKELVSY